MKELLDLFFRDNDGTRREPNALGSSDGSTSTSPIPAGELLLFAAVTGATAFIASRPEVKQQLAGALGALSKKGLELSQTLTGNQIPQQPHQKQPAKALPMQQDEGSWGQKQKFESLAPPLQRKLYELFTILHEMGYDPQIRYGWRTLKTQKSLVSSGKSRRKFSMHCAMYQGKMASLAVDVYDPRFGWTSPQAKKFWADMQNEAKKLDLHTRPGEPWHLQAQPDDLLPQVIEAYKQSRNEKSAQQ